MSSNTCNDRLEVVLDSFRNDFFSSQEDIGGVGKVRPNLEAIDFIPKTLDSRFEKS